MLRSVLLGVVLAGVLAGCSLGSGSGRGGSSNAVLGTLREPASANGFSGKSEVLFGYAYAHCYTFAWRSANADPPGSSPPIYPMDRAYPLVMIGSVRPHGRAELRAAKEGCAGAIVTAFAEAHFKPLAPICNAMSGWVPATVTACKGVDG
jgi:hypothetical protein